MKFKDSKGREWVVRIDFHTLCRIEDELEYSIMEDPTNLPTGVRPYVEMLWICVENQASESGVTPEDFGKSLDGPAIKAGIDCFVREYAVFLEAPAPAMARALLTVWNQVEETGPKLAEAVEQVIVNQFSRLQALPTSHHGNSHSGN